jgi:hypothetical protein
MGRRLPSEFTLGVDPSACILTKMAKALLRSQVFWSIEVEAAAKQCVGKGSDGIRDWDELAAVAAA